MISFKNSSSLVDIEEASASLDTSNEVSLRFPTSLKHGGGFGIVASLIQFVAKQTRLQPETTLSLHSSSATSEGFDALAQEPHGISALYFVPFITMPSGAREPSRMVLERSIPRIQAMQSGEFLKTMHGRGAFLACFAGARNEFLLPFYSRGQRDSLRGREEFGRLTEQLIDACAPQARRQISERSVKAVSNLIYELFRNTDEHAQDDENGIAYRRNARGMLVKFISFSGNTLTDDVSGPDAAQNIFLLRALSNQKHRTDDDGRRKASTDISFLEITVFDTGPGLVRRWLSKYKPSLRLEDLSIEEEVHFVSKCFEQHATTKDNEESGHGLDLVVSSLHELNAFLRLRTGRICLVQDFSSASSSAFKPRHWFKDRQKLPIIPGAAYSIFVPLSRGKK